MTHKDFYYSNTKELHDIFNNLQKKVGTPKMLDYFTTEYNDNEIIVKYGFEGEDYVNSYDMFDLYHSQDYKNQKDATILANGVDLHDIYDVKFNDKPTFSIGLKQKEYDSLKEINDRINGIFKPYNGINLSSEIANDELIITLSYKGVSVSKSYIWDEVSNVDYCKSDKSIFALVPHHLSDELISEYNKTFEKDLQNSKAKVRQQHNKDLQNLKREFNKYILPLYFIHRRHVTLQPEVIRDENNNPVTFKFGNKIILHGNISQYVDIDDYHSIDIKEGEYVISTYKRVIGYKPNAEMYKFEMWEKGVEPKYRYLEKHYVDYSNNDLLFDGAFGIHDYQYAKTHHGPTKAIDDAYYDTKEESPKEEQIRYYDDSNYVAELIITAEEMDQPQTCLEYYIAYEDASKTKPIGIIVDTYTHTTWNYDVKNDLEYPVL